jgi:tetratricopeptide (TPR) repeat protein
MKIEDIDKEFKELAQSLKDGQAAFVSGHFKEAEPLYKRALELLERSYGEEHSDTALCLQNLADCHYNLRKYGEAIPLLRRLLIIKEKHQGVSHPDVATTLFKLAKVYEKSGMPKESESFYRRALKVGEQAYGLNHQFVGTILESFSAMLKRAQMRLPEAAQMEDRLREMREITAGPQIASSKPPGQTTAKDIDANADQSVSAKLPDQRASGRYNKLDQSASGRYDRPDQSSSGRYDKQGQSASGRYDKPDQSASGRYDKLDQSASGRQMTPDQSVSGKYNLPDQNVSTRMRSLKSATERIEAEPEPEPEAKPPAMGIFLIILFVFVVATAGTTFFLLNAQNKEGKNLVGLFVQTSSNNSTNAEKAVEKPKSQEFLSTDGLKRLVIKSPREAFMLRKGIVMNGTAEVDDHTITFVPQTQSSIKYQFTRTPGGISDSDNTELYARDSAESVIITKMQILAVIMQRYYGQFHYYPRQIDDLLSGNQHIVYKNPWTKQEMLPVKKKLPPAAELDPEDAMPSDIALLQSAMQNLLVSPPNTVVGGPGVIEWYLSKNTPEGEAVYIRGTDGSGNLLRASHPGAVYVIQLVAGRRKPDLE